MAVPSSLNASASSSNSCSPPFLDPQAQTTVTATKTANCTLKNTVQGPKVVLCRSNWVPQPGSPQIRDHVLVPQRTPAPPPAAVRGGTVALTNNHSGIFLSDLQKHELQITACCGASACQIICCLCIPCEGSELVRTDASKQAYELAKPSW